MDGRRNRRKKAAFSNFSNVAAWTGLNCTEKDKLYIDINYGSMFDRIVIFSRQFLLD